MQHVIVTGPPGSGKSTFARRISAARQMPVLCVDEYIHQGGELKLAALAEPHILEGHYFLTNEWPEVHEVHLLQAPRRVLIERLIRRGWVDEDNNLQQGEESRETTEKLVDHFIYFNDCKGPKEIDWSA